MFNFLWPGKADSNLRHEPPGIEWNSGDPAASLAKVNEYAEKMAQSAVAWYYRKKTWKARWSRLLRYCAIFSMALAGLLPIVASTWPDLPAWGIVPTTERRQLLVSLFVGLGGLCIAIDRFGGCSTGWIRYIRTAAEIEKLIQEYRMDWTRLEAQGTGAPDAGNVEARISRARELVVGVQTLVLDETRAWATEFESNLSQMEKEAKEFLERDRQELRSRLDQSKPGNLSLKVTNALATGSAGFRVYLDAAQGRIVDGEQVQARDTWIRLGLPPGSYSLLVMATIGATPASAAKVVEIAPGKTHEASVNLEKAAGAAEG